MPDTLGAFLSYSRKDDRHDGEFITRFLRLVREEVKQQSRLEFYIFQDKADINWGDEWASSIEHALAASTFLIPVITPRYLASSNCRDEFTTFHQLEQARGHNDRILPLYYVSADEIHEKARREQDQIAQILATRQWFDIRDLRTEDESSPKVRRAVREIADQLVRRLRSGDRASTTPAPVTSAHVRVVSRPPDLIPSQFRDRSEVTDELLGRLSRPDRRLIELVGDDGIGKTALISQVLKRLTDGDPPTRFDAFGYLSTRSYAPVSAFAIVQHLAATHPDAGTRSRLSERLNSERLTVLEKLDAVLGELDRIRVLLVVDNAEELLDVSGRIADGTLARLVKDLADRTDHGVQLLLVSSRRPEWNIRGYRANDVVHLRDGLPVDEIETFLRGLEPEGARLLGEMAAAEVAALHKATDGRPRTLELIYASLGDTATHSLTHLLKALADVSAQSLPLHLLGRLAQRQSMVDTSIMQTIAVLGRPVTADVIGRMLATLPQDDISAALDRLAARRLIRTHDGRFYLPPSEVEHVREWIPRATQVAEFGRAADIFADQASRTSVRRVEDLAPHLSEIDMRIHAGEYHRALELMNGLDDAYLAGRGQSDALSRWRGYLGGKLDSPREVISNLSYVADARRQQSNYEGQLKAIQRARYYNKRAPDPDVEMSLDVMLGGAHYDAGRVRKASAVYQGVLERAMDLGDQLTVAEVHSGLALCHVDTGDLDEARRHIESASAVARCLRDEGVAIRAQLLLNRAVIDLFRGDAAEALDAAELAATEAQARADDILVGKCLDIQALAHLDLRAPEQALERARRAATIGEETATPELVHAANGTIARIHLSQNRVELAAAAVKAAARYGRSSHALETWALDGIIAWRCDQRARAKEAFLRTHAIAGELINRDRACYLPFDINGVALAGLVLCGEPERLRPAVQAYVGARTRASAPGIKRLAVQLLAELCRGGDEELLRDVYAAARGRRP
ncbi:TIR domain-containing protein [Dactylosporangium sp. CA-139114]|uniref:TIR domain-containing protein n=1 Tax=Dactylosporangium sp. CA-139114 TaxID=3239931 RepID=UPI003D987E04